MTVIVTEAEQQRIKNLERQQSLCSLLSSTGCCLRHGILSVTGWTVEVKMLKQKLMQLEKERGMTQKLCQDQENELLVTLLHYRSCLLCDPLQLQRNSQEELNQNLSKLSAEVSISAQLTIAIHRMSNAMGELWK